MNKLLSITILLSLFLIACNNSSKNKKGKNTDEELSKQKKLPNSGAIQVNQDPNSGLN